MNFTSSIFSVSERQKEIALISVCESMNGISIYDGDTLEKKRFFQIPAYDSMSYIMPFSYIVISTGDGAILAPRWHVKPDYIGFFDYRSNQMDFIDIDGTKKLLDDEENIVAKDYMGIEMPYDLSPKFACILEYGKKHYLIPASYPAIVELDIRTHEVKYYDDFISDVLAIVQKKGNKNGYAFGYATKMKKNIYITCRYVNAIVEFNLETKKGRVIDMPVAGRGNHNICNDGESIYFTNIDGSMLRKYSFRTREYKEYPIECDGGASTIASMAYYERKVYISREGREKDSIVFDTMTEQYVKKQEIAKRFGKDTIRAFFSLGDEMLIITYGGKISKVKEDGLIHKSIFFTKDELIEMEARANQLRFLKIKNRLSKEGRVMEGDVTLQELMSYLQKIEV